MPKTLENNPGLRMDLRVAHKELGMMGLLLDNAGFDYQCRDLPIEWLKNKDLVMTRIYAWEKGSYEG